MHPLPRLLSITLLTLPVIAHAQATFDVAVIRPSAQSVPFESNGTTEAAHGTLTMRDVTVATCIHWAYGVPIPIIRGPESLKSIHYDITAKAEAGTTEARLRLMLRALLAERFHLAFHRNTVHDQRVYALTIAASGIRMHPSAPATRSSHQNSHTGMVAHSMTMHQLADYLSEALDAPLADNTSLPAPYDFTIDFTPYVDAERVNNERPDPAAVLHAALKGQLGLELVRSKAPVELFTVDHVDPPTPN